ncbi:MAG: histone deacetylase family protein, partial [Pseudomonadota bacterium]
MTDNTLAYFTADICTQHAMHPHHPESPMRLTAITQAIRKDKRFAIVETKPSDLHSIAKVHTADHIALCQSPVTENLLQLDPDTAINPSSWEAALHGVGAAKEAIDAVMQGQYQHGFCGVRPPGHHAEPDRVMG